MPEESLGLYNADLPEARQELLSSEFEIWEKRGRGWNVYSVPVELEPPFCPFYYLLNIPEAPVTDDGRSETFLSRLAGGSAAQLSVQQNAYNEKLTEYLAALENEREPSICRYYNEQFYELRMILPEDFALSHSKAENLLISFSYLSAPVALEIIGSKNEIVIQFSCTERDIDQVKQQTASHIPDSRQETTVDYLNDLWVNSESSELIVEFGLSNEFALPLKTPPATDFLVTVIGALSDLSEGEIGVVQILFQKTKDSWAEEVLEAIRCFESTSPFSDSKHKLPLAKEKISSPLFAASIKVGAKGFHSERTLQIARNLGSGLAHFANPSGNELIPLSNDDYPEEFREQGLLNRQTFRSGMLLNSKELVSLAHLPFEPLYSEKLLTDSENSKPAPGIAANIQSGLRLGENIHHGQTTGVFLSESQRTRHMHLIGASGSGKSTLMLNFIKQDLESGKGLCVIDPHGDLIDDILSHVPENRTKDIMLFDPADEDYPIGFNILKANSELEKTLLSSDLVATFRRLSTSWGDVMDSVLSNALLAFVESTRGGTLFELKRFLVEKDFREEFLKSVTDEAIRYFWLKEFPQLGGKPQSSILIRLDAFLRQKLVRNIVCQKETSLNFREIMDRRKILLLKLSQGAIGEENSYLLGTLMVSKLHQVALSRQDTSKRPFFALYMDEFQNFITPSMESILSGVRKYNLGLVLAHQEFRQMLSKSPEVASSVLSNCYTRICFRLGDTDAEKFAGGFSFFDAKDLQNLGVGEAIARVERSEYDFNLKTELVPKPREELIKERTKRVLETSREKYARAKSEVEKEILKTTQFDSQTPEPKEHETETAPKNKKETKTKGSVAPDNEHHRYLQSVIKRIGEKNGFISTLEKPVLGGVGKIDIALEKDDLKIACEIAHTNSVSYEVQNIQKCLASGFKKVVVISENSRHLSKIKKEVKKVISKDQLEQTHFLEPDNFHLFLENMEQKKEIEEKRIRGFKVKTSVSESSDQDAKQKNIAKIISDALKRNSDK